MLCPDAETLRELTVLPVRQHRPAIVCIFRCRTYMKLWVYVKHPRPVCCIGPFNFPAYFFQRPVSYEDVAFVMEGHRAHGVVVSHPLSMREALGSIPSGSILSGDIAQCVERLAAG